MTVQKNKENDRPQWFERTLSYLHVCSGSLDFSAKYLPQPCLTVNVIKFLSEGLTCSQTWSRMNRSPQILVVWQAELTQDLLEGTSIHNATCCCCPCYLGQEPAPKANTQKAISAALCGVAEKSAGNARGYDLEGEACKAVDVGVLRLPMRANMS